MTSIELRKLLSYEPQTGRFKWLTGPKAGQIVRTLPNSEGYLRIGIGGIRYFAHRLAWLYVHGWWPRGRIDHIDGTRTNNAISNLRDVDASGNALNLHKPHRDSSTGMLGVTKNGKGYLARLSVNGKTINLGTFKTPEEAGAAYAAAKALVEVGETRRLPFAG